MCFFIQPPHQRAHARCPDRHGNCTRRPIFFGHSSPGSLGILPTTLFHTLSALLRVPGSGAHRILDWQRNRYTSNLARRNFSFTCTAVATVPCVPPPARRHDAQVRTYAFSPRVRLSLASHPSTVCRARARALSEPVRVPHTRSHTRVRVRWGGIPVCAHAQPVMYNTFPQKGNPKREAGTCCVGLYCRTT